MSWSITLHKIAADQVTRAIVDAPTPAGMPTETATEVEYQIATAKAAALMVFTNGVVGSPEEGEYSIHLSGHAEPNHTRRKGYSSDMVTVTVQQYYDYSNDGVE